MNATIRRTAVALGLLILALMINANVLAVIPERRAEGARRQPATDHRRVRPATGLDPGRPQGGGQVRPHR